MQASRRAIQIVKLKERRQEMAAKTRDADRILADRLRRLRTDETKSEHKRETRRRIIIGAIVRAAQESQTDISHGWLDEQIRPLKRPAAASSVSRCRAVRRPGRRGQAARPAPITARQKKLLARPVEENPRLARELGKAKATSLIGPMHDRVDALAPPDER